MKKKITNLIATLSVALSACVLFSGCATTGAEASAEGSTSANGSMIIMLVVMAAAFYFLLIRPENKKRKKADEMRNSLSVGDKITTIGGIVGKVVELNGDLITFETGEDRVRLQVTKWAVSTNTVDKTGEASKQ